MSRPNVEDIGARAAAATPGPWIVRASDATIVHLAPGSGYLTIASVRSWDRIGENAAFVSHAREDVPALIAYVRELEDALRSLRAPWDRRDE